MTKNPPGASFVFFGKTNFMPLLKLHPDKSLSLFPAFKSSNVLEIFKITRRVIHDLVDHDLVWFGANRGCSTQRNGDGHCTSNTSIDNKIHCEAVN